MLKEGLLKENIDGEALEWAFKRTINRQEKEKFLWLYLMEPLLTIVHYLLMMEIY